MNGEIEMDRRVIEKTAKFHCRIEVAGTEGLTGKFFQISFKNVGISKPKHINSQTAHLSYFYSLYLLLCATEVSVSGSVWLLSSQAGPRAVGP